MNDRTDAERISDMLHYAQEAIATLGGISYTDFCNDRKTQLAVLYLIAVVGEAASKTGDDTLRMFPGVPWHKVRGTRNHLVHEYYAVKFKIAYDIVVEHLPQLITELTGTTASNYPGNHTGNYQGGQLL